MRLCFDFSKWRPSAILDFQKLEILTSGLVPRPNMRHRAKFREDRSNRSGDMADFRFFKMAAAAVLDVGNFKPRAPQPGWGARDLTALAV